MFYGYYKMTTKLEKIQKRGGWGRNFTVSIKTFE